MRRALTLSLLAVATLTTTASTYGGWTVVTVHELPTHFEVGQPATLTFTMRQHGETIADGRRPKLRLRDGSVLSGFRSVDATPTGKAGVYRASWVPTKEGTVSLRVDTDNHDWEVRLLPFSVVAKGAAAPSVDPVARGRSLYVAKGCIACHSKADDATLADIETVRVGVDLGGQKFSPEYVTAKILAPRTTGTQVLRGVQMPALEVTRGEAEQIAQYLAQREVAVRSGRGGER